MQFEMHAARRVQGNVVFVPFPVFVMQVLHKQLYDGFHLFFADQNIDVAARPHPRLGIEPANDRAFERDMLYFRGFESLAKFFQLVVDLFIAVYRHLTFAGKFFRGIVV